MTEGQTARPRRRARFSLVAVLLTLFVSALPGTASATPPPKAVPLVDCYAVNTDGSITIILGYNSTYTSTKTIAQGSTNHATPSKYTATLPTVFKPGLQHGAAKVTIPQTDLFVASWYLDGSTLNYWNAAQNVGVCSAAQLPAYANGAAVVILLLIAGVIGLLVVRRSRRRAAAPVPTS